MEIKHVCSMGTLCHSSMLIKKNNLKKCSYPFDWIFSNPDMIIDCIEDDFLKYLDKQYYIHYDNACVNGHSIYNSRMFKHHNPLTNEDHYNYFIRCVNRFRQLIKNKELKLFCTIFLSANLNEYTKNNIISFNNKLLKYVENYRLLVIFQNISYEQKYNLSTHENIDFLELYTLSISNGVQFLNNEDNIFLNNILKHTYRFDI